MGNSRTRLDRWLLSRDFALLWTGRGISQFGDVVFDTTLILWIAITIARGQSWAPLAVSGVLLAALAPPMVAGPFAGVLVDRWDARRTLLAMDAIRGLLIVLLLFAAGVVALPFLPGGPLPPVWMLTAIYTVVVVEATCTAFANPAGFGFLSTVVEADLRTRAAARLEVNTSVAFVIGPPVAALIFGLGIEWALLLDALTFVVSFVATLSIRPARGVPTEPPARAGGFIHEMAEGLAFFGRNRVLVTLSISAVAALVGLGALNTLNVFFVTQNLHAPARLYGLLNAFLGAGSVFGALAAAAVVGRIGGLRTYWLSLVAVAVLYIMYSRLSSLAPALAVFFIVGFPSSATSVALGPLLIEVSPPHMIGRIVSVFYPMMAMGRLLAAFLSGFLASSVLRTFHASLLGMRFGPIDTIFMGAGLLCLGVGLWTAWRLHESPRAAPVPVAAEST